MAELGVAGAKVQQTVAKASPWIETAGRWGYAAKGVIYGLIGVLAFLAATGNGGKTTDSHGVINTIAEQPFGGVLLWVLAAGLLGYAAFKLFMAALNPENKKPLRRAADLVTGLAYAGLSIIAVTAAMGDRSSSNSEEKAAGVMSYPAGQYLVAAIGLVILGVGVAQIVNGWTAKFMEILRTDRMDEGERKFAEVSGRVGFIARGIVFMVTGGFLTMAGINHDPKKAGGLDQALDAIAKAPFGPLLLAAIGIGLIAFALHMFVEAKYRKFAIVRPERR